MCKERWEGLRSRYRKHVNRKTKSGQAAAHSQKWKYEDPVSVLSALMKDRARLSSLQKAKSQPEYSDNAQNDGTQELCSEQEREENDDVVDVPQTALQQERLTHERKNRKITVVHLLLL